jgi:signal transduction histidine kinase
MDSANTYEITPDIDDTRRAYLGTFLLIALIGGIPIFALSTVLNPQSGINLPVWITYFGSLILSSTLRNHNQTKRSAWIFLLGILASLMIQIITRGPNTNVFILMFIPTALSGLLLDRQEIGPVTAISVFGMVISTSIATTFVQTLTSTLVYVVVNSCIAALLYVREGDIMEMVYWAIDIQQKDARRAESFYQQSEQLRDALLQLTHANSSLEILNKKLGEAQRKTEQASKAKSVFMSNMSHELRTPLNVVIGYSSSMLNMPQMFDDISVPDVHRPYLQLIEENGNYLVGLINDILDLSKIEAGKLELHPTSITLPELFRGVLATATGLIKGKPIQLRPDFPTDLPRVWADPMRVRQILLNLLSNAIKFTETGSVTLSARLEDGHIRISVTDTGIGIPEKSLAAIFDRFEQAEHDTDKRYGGTGLGLDISKQLSLMHGGDLTVTSTVGQGSTFTFTLTLATQEQNENANAEGLLDGGVMLFSQQTLVEDNADAMQTVLIVTEESKLRAQMRNALEGLGYVVVEGSDLDHALDLALGLLPAAIVIGTSDGEFFDRLRKQSDTASIPVVRLWNGMPLVNESLDKRISFMAMKTPLDTNTFTNLIAQVAPLPQIRVEPAN